MTEKYLFVVSTVNQVLTARDVIRSLSLVGQIELVVFGSRSHDEMAAIQAKAMALGYEVVAKYWLQSMSVVGACKAFKAFAASTNYEEAFFFSYYTYYSLLFALLKRTGVKVSIAEEGLGTYRVCAESGIPPLPLGLKLKAEQSPKLSPVYLLLDKLNRSITKRALVNTMRLVPSGVGAFLSRPFEVYRLVVCYPLLLQHSFQHKLTHELKFDDQSIDAQNIEVLSVLKQTEGVVYFASQPMLWDAHGSLDELVDFLVGLEKKFESKIIFVPHPRDRKCKLDELKNKVNGHNVELLLLPKPQKLEAIVRHTKPKMLLGLSSSALLYCREWTRCKSVTSDLPKCYKSDEVLYHDYIYREVLKRLESEKC